MTKMAWILQKHWPHSGVSHGNTILPFHTLRNRNNPSHLGDDEGDIQFSPGGYLL